MEQSQPVLSSAVMPSSAATASSAALMSGTPIVSLTTRKRMYPRISKENSDKALLGIGELVRQRWLIKVWV